MEVNSFSFANQRLWPMRKEKGKQDDVYSKQFML
jgi:hypothetical protein